MILILNQNNNSNNNTWLLDSYKILIGILKKNKNKNKGE